MALNRLDLDRERPDVRAGIGDHRVAGTVLVRDEECELIVASLESDVAKRHLPASRRGVEQFGLESLAPIRYPL